jgi:RNA polymerase sigma factor (TIGR02999 family)
MNAQAGARSRHFFRYFFPRDVCHDRASAVNWHLEREIKPVKSSDRDSEASEKEATVADKGEVTRWLIAGSGGDGNALESLLPLVYEELHRQAVRFFRRERAGHTLQPTALVNDVYLRLINQHEVSWQNRAQFFGIAAQMMRRILVSHARGREAQKRGGAAQHITLEEELAAAPQRDLNLLDLDDALTKLETVDPDKSRMVELRFFTGLSVEETAEVMGVSPRTVDRQWQTAKAWLHREISAGKAA